MADEIKKLDEQNGKFTYDVKRFAENEDFKGLTEYVQNRIEQDGKKNKEDTTRIISEKLEAKMNEFINRIPIERKALEPEQKKVDGTGGFKTAGEYALAVAKEGRFTSNPSDIRLKALSEGTGADGGYTVPADFYSMMEKDHLESAVLRGAGATVIPCSGDAVNIPIPKDSAHASYLYGGMIAYWKGEAAALTEASPKIDEVRIPVHKLTGFSYASSELLEDNAVGMGNFITSKWGKAIGWYEDKAFFQGTGVGEPLGIVNSSALISATRSAASVFTLGDAADVLCRLYGTSIGNAVWFIHPRLLSELIQMVASSVVWISQEQGATKAPTMKLFGMPIYITEHCKYLNTAGDVLLVDPSYYIIADKPGVRVDASTEFRFNYDQTTFRIIKRVGGAGAVDATTTLLDGTHTVSWCVTVAAA